MSRGVASRLGVAALVAALLGGCGGDGSSATAQRATTAPAAAVSVTTPPRPRPKRPQFDSVAEAVKYIETRVDVPVIVPSDLPAGTTVHSVYSDVKGSAQLNLRLPWPRALTIQYGKAGFDGCGPLHPRQVSVAGMPAVVNSSKLHVSDKRFDGRTYTTLVWPATLKDLEGRYGLSGIFSVERMLAFAESMERARAAKPRGPKNC